MNELKIGSKIKIINIDNGIGGFDDNEKYKDKIGIVTQIMDDGSIWGTWGGISLLPTDDYVILDDEPMKILKLEDEVYTEFDISNMSVVEIKNILARCNSTIQSIGVKKNQFITDNMNRIHDKKYWSKLNSYKFAISKIQESIAWISKIKREKQKIEIDDKEHYFYMFYKTAKDLLSTYDFDNIIQTMLEKGYDLNKVLDKKYICAI